MSCHDFNTLQQQGFMKRQKSMKSLLANKLILYRVLPLRRWESLNEASFRNGLFLHLPQDVSWGKESCYCEIRGVFNFQHLNLATRKFEL